MYGCISTKGTKGTNNSSRRAATRTGTGTVTVTVTGAVSSTSHKLPSELPRGGRAEGRRKHLYKVSDDILEEVEQGVKALDAQCTRLVQDSRLGNLRGRKQALERECVLVCVWVCVCVRVEVRCGRYVLPLFRN